MEKLILNSKKRTDRDENRSGSENENKIQGGSDQDDSMYLSKQFMERYLCYSIRVCQLGREEKERTMNLAVFEFCTRSLKERWRLKHTPTRFRFMPAQMGHVLYKCIVYIRRFLQMLDRGKLKPPNLAVIVALGWLFFRSCHVLGAVGGPSSDGCPEAGYRKGMEPAGQLPAVPSAQCWC